MRTPVVDLIIDGDRHDAGVHAELAGLGLTYTPGVDAKREPVLYGFTTPGGLSEHLAATEPLVVRAGGRHRHHQPGLAVRRLPLLRACRSGR